MLKKGFTLLELLWLIVMLLLFISLVQSLSKTISRKSNYVACTPNLDQIGKSLKLYIIDFGRNVNYPPRNGAGFLTTLYKETVLVESSIYLCPSTPDTNDQVDLGKITGSDKASQNYISYSGRKNSNPKIYPGIFKPHKDATITTVSSDDWQKKINHDDRFNFLFLDGHAERGRYLGDTHKDYLPLSHPLTN